MMDTQAYVRFENGIQIVFSPMGPGPLPGVIIVIGGRPRGSFDREMQRLLKI
jgi:hypothetical protein